MMTSRRVPLKKFWGRAKRGREETVPVSLYVVPSLYFAAESRYQNSHVCLSWWSCWYCYWSSAVSDEICFLTLTLICLCCTVWWLMSSFWNFHHCQPPVASRPRGGEECIHCHVVLVVVSHKPPSSKNPKNNSKGRGGVPSFPPPPWLLLVYHAVAKWWRGHAPCLTHEIIPVASLLTWIAPTIVWRHHGRSHQFHRFGWKPNHQSPWSVKLWLGTCSWILQPCCRCQRDERQRMLDRDSSAKREGGERGYCREEKREMEG